VTNKNRFGVDTELSEELSLMVTDIPRTTAHPNRLEIKKHESITSDIPGARGGETGAPSGR